MSIYHVHTGRPHDMAKHLIESHGQDPDDVADVMLCGSAESTHSLLHEIMGREVPFGGVEGCRRKD